MLGSVGAWVASVGFVGFVGFVAVVGLLGDAFVAGGFVGVDSVEVGGFLQPQRETSRHAINTILILRFIMCPPWGFLYFSTHYIIFPHLWQSYSYSFCAVILDKIGILMVKYLKMNIAVNGKSTMVKPAESLGHWLKVRTVSAIGKCVRERVYLSDK